MIRNDLDGVNLITEILIDFWGILSRIFDLLLIIIELGEYQVEISGRFELVRLLLDGMS